MRNRLIFCLVLVLLAGCSTHFTSLQPEGEKQQVLFVISEEQALKIAYSALSITIPGERIESIGGPVKGYSAIYRFAWDSYTQVVLLRPAQGVDESGATVQGYYFEVSGSGSSYIKGKGKNVDLFNTVVEYAKATGKAIKVSQVKPMIQLDPYPAQPVASLGGSIKTSEPQSPSKLEVVSVETVSTTTPKSTGVAGGNQRRTALVIGNSAYRAAPLKNPVNDARDMASTLKGLGFEVMIVTDATQQQIETAVRDFGTKLRQGGVGLFYYAGHGVQVAGENYLIPVNAVIQSEGDVKYGSVNAGLVLAKMEDAGNGLNIVILDACRSNPFARSFRTATEGLAKMDAPTGSLIAYATAPGSVAADGQGRNGVYTKHLLEALKIKGLPISEAFMRVRQGVVQETAKKQVPWEASSLIGQFYFAN